MPHHVEFDANRIIELQTVSRVIGKPIIVYKKIVRVLAHFDGHRAGKKYIVHVAYVENGIQMIEALQTVAFPI